VLVQASSYSTANGGTSDCTRGQLTARIWPSTSGGTTLKCRLFWKRWCALKYSMGPHVRVWSRPVAAARTLVSGLVAMAVCSSSDRIHQPLAKVGHHRLGPVGHNVQIHFAGIVTFSFSSSTPISARFL